MAACCTTTSRKSGFGTSTNVRDTFAPSMLQQDIISPTRNYTGFLTGTYDTDLLGDGQLYFEMLVTRRKSQQNGQRQFTLDYPRTTRCSGSNGGLFNCLDSGTPPRVNSAIGVRVFADYGIYDSSQTQDFVKFSGGFRGDLPFFRLGGMTSTQRRAGRMVLTATSRSLRIVCAQSLNVRLVNAAGTRSDTRRTLANTPGSICLRRHSGQLRSRSGDQQRNHRWAGTDTRTGLVRLCR